MSTSSGRRDIQRNSAYFLGAAGTTLGVLGGIFSALGIVVWLDPAFGQTAPDWFFALVIILLIVLVIGGWPALDILTNRRPRMGGAVMAVLGLLLIALGLVAAFWTAWGIAGWLSILGGVLLLLSGYLALVGGGTEPLTWHSLRTPRVRAAEARLNPIVETVYDVASIISLVAVGVSGVASLVMLVSGAVDGQVWLALGLLAGIGLLGIVWRVLAKRRR